MSYAAQHSVKRYLVTGIKQVVQAGIHFAAKTIELINNSVAELYCFKR